MQTRVRKAGADEDRTTGNLLTAASITRRPGPKNSDTLPDPHWHRHLLVWNATYDPVEDRIKAGQLGNVVRDKGYYRAAFYARLACKLEALGYAIDRRGGNEWEIAGVPQSTIDTFSKRTAQIEAEAEKQGITDAARKAELGAKIRAKKQKELTLPELRKAWDAQLVRRGAAGTGGGVPQGNPGGRARHAGGSRGVRHRPLLANRNRRSRSGN